MERDHLGFSRPIVNAEICIDCGACEQACPAIGERSVDQLQSVSWAKSDSSELLDRSSSGGIFGLLARKVLSEGGIVCGAAFDEGCRTVRHVLVGNEVGLDAVMRSKYVQSSIGKEVYRGVRNAIRSGRRVLFAGTACQVAGMSGYLGKLGESDLFLSVDVICHGVPSPELWSQWIDYRGEAFGSDVCDVNMRSKTAGWLSYSTIYEYIAEKDPSSPCESTIFNQDWYMKAFLANASLRPSCFQCPAKRGCGSDITLGDFWGFQSIHPEVDYSKGISAVLCNTKKGERAFNAISRLTLNGPATLEEVIAGNPSLVSSVAPYPKRDEFLRDVASGSSIPDLISKWDFRPTLIQRISSKLGGIKRRFKKIIARGA